MAGRDARVRDLQAKYQVRELGLFASGQDGVSYSCPNSLEQSQS